MTPSIGLIFHFTAAEKAQIRHLGQATKTSVSPVLFLPFFGRRRNMNRRHISIFTDERVSIYYYSGL